MRIGIKSVLLLTLLACLAALAHAQSCRGSYVTYIVRDATGKIIKQPSGSSVSYAGGTSPDSPAWRFSIQGEFVNAAIKLPAAVAAVANDVSGFTASKFCNFSEPATLKVTIGGKTMELTFKFPKMGEQDSADFVVDSLPFKAGKYTITLAKPGGYGAYFAASGWKKVE